MPLYFDSVAHGTESIIGSGGDDVFQLNVPGLGWNYVNTGTGNDVVLGLGRAPAHIADVSGADVYQFILRETPGPMTFLTGTVLQRLSSSSAYIYNFDTDDVVQIPSATYSGQPRLFSPPDLAVNYTRPYGISGAREGAFVGFYFETSGDWLPDYYVTFYTDFGPARFHTSQNTISGISFIEIRLRTGVVADTPNMVYRFFNMQTGSQFLTASETEREVVLNGMQNMNFEGTGFRVAEAPGAGLVPVYRFNNLATGGHLFTASEGERAALASNRGFRAENIGFYADPDGGPRTQPVYRFLDTRTGGHLFTASPVERDAILVGQPHLQAEGIGFWTPA
jgi:Repeat of unknown function (DUF5648)